MSIETSNAGQMLEYRAAVAPRVTPVVLAKSAVSLFNRTITAGLFAVSTLAHANEHYTLASRITCAFVVPGLLVLSLFLPRKIRFPLSVSLVIFMLGYCFIRLAQVASAEVRFFCIPLVILLMLTLVSEVHIHERSTTTD